MRCSTYASQAMNGGPIHFLAACWGGSPNPELASNVYAVAHTIFAIFAYTPILQKCLPESIPDPLNYLVTELNVKPASPSADAPAERKRHENLNSLPVEKSFL